VATSIDDQTWDAARTVVPVEKTSIDLPILGGSAPVENYVNYAGKQFARTGEFWVDYVSGLSRLSPNKEWLILQSRSRAGRGSAYFDVFNVGTGRKLITINGSFNEPFPDDMIDKTFWLTNKYFFIPMGPRREGLVVCEFGSAKA
jgi:hypothetical protein